MTEGKKIFQRCQRWIFVEAGVSLLGLVASIYSTYHHVMLRYAGVVNSFCNIGEKFSCDKVAQSRFSEILQVPLGVWGIAFFAVCLLCCSLVYASPNLRQAAWIYLRLLAVVGVISSLALGYVSKVILNTICPSCSVTYLACILLFGFTTLHRNRMGGASSWKSPSLVTLIALSLGIVCIFAVTYRVARPFLAQGLLRQKIASMTNYPLTIVERFADLKVNDIPIEPTKEGFGDHIRGGADAKITIVEFGDLECPNCQALYPTLKDIHSEYQNEVRTIFKHFPLNRRCNSAVPDEMHFQACDEALYVICAGKFGKFWELHDYIYEHQWEITSDSLNQWVANAGLPREEILACVKSEAAIAKVKMDTQLGQKLGVASTPTLFINGRRYTGPMSLGALRSYITLELNR